MTDVDPLLERINQVLAECDARTLPPMMSGTAVAALDLVEQAGVKLAPWQQGLVQAMFADDMIGRRLVYPPRPATIRGTRACEPIIDQVAVFTSADVARAFDVPMGLIDSTQPMPARRPWWRRWWSR